MARSMAFSSCICLVECLPGTMLGGGYKGRLTTVLALKEFMVYGEVSHTHRSFKLSGRYYSGDINRASGPWT